MRRILAAGAAALAAVVFVASCDDGFDRLPFEPEPLPEAPQAMVTCTVDVREATMTCGAPETDLPDEARGALTVGGQGEFVTLASSGVCYGAACEPDAPADIFRADVTVQNLIPQALGTTDGATGDTSGVRIFFHDAPTVTNGTGTVSVANEDGIGTFTGTGQPYFQYGGSVDDLLGPDDILSPSETSAPKTWEWKVPATVLEFEFSVYVHAEVQFPDGWIDVTPATQTLGLGAGDLRTVTLSGTVRDAVGREVTGGTLTWSSSDESVATVDASTGEVTAVAPGVATITATDGTVSGKAEITVAASLTDDAYAETVIGNVSINTAEAEGGPFTVVANDAFLEGDTISFAGWNGTAGTTEQGGDVVMTTSGAAMGQFTYDPPAGYTGADQFMYVIGEDTATVTLTVAGMIWFIDNEAAACTSVAAGCGRLSSPFSSLDAFKAVNNGMGNNPANGDAIFLYESATPYAGPLTLRMGQMLIGQDATGSLAGIIGITPSASSASLPATDGSTPDPTHTTIEGTTGGIVLGRDNTLRGLTVATTGGVGISGNGFGTLTLGGDVEVAAQNGAALQLSNGTFDGAFRSVSANGGTHGIELSSTTGTFAVTGAGSAASGGTIENMAGDGISLTGTGPVELAWMAIRNNDGNGVFGFTVAGFTLRQSTVSGNGSFPSPEDTVHATGLFFAELTGTARIDTVTITDSFDHNVRIANTGGTLDLMLHGSTITNTVKTAAGGSRVGVYVRPVGNATINVTATGNAFSVVEGENFGYEMAGGGGGHVEFGDNTVSGDGDSGIEIQSASFDPGTWGGRITFDIFGNHLSGVSIPIRLQAIGTTAAAELSGYVRDNTIGNDTAGSCGSTGIDIALTGDGTHTVQVTGNVLKHCESTGISAFTTDGGGSGDLNLTVLGNEVLDLGANRFDSFELTLGNSADDAYSACLVLGGTDEADKNTFDQGLVFGLVHVYLAQQPTITTLFLPGFSASGGGLVADVEAYLAARNRTQGGEAFVLDPASQLSNVQGITSCPTPGFAP